MRGGSPRDHWEGGVAPVVLDLVQVGVADAGIRDLNGHIIGANIAAGELVWSQVAAVVLGCPRNGISSALDGSALLLQGCCHVSKGQLSCRANRRWKRKPCDFSVASRVEMLSFKG